MARPVILESDSFNPGRNRVQPSLTIEEAYLSGLSYYDYPSVNRCIKKGDFLTLKREPSNKHDAHAIAVFFCGRKLGYWPIPGNKEIASYMDKGYKCRAKVVKVNQENIYEAILAEAQMKESIIY